MGSYQLELLSHCFLFDAKYMKYLTCVKKMQAAQLQAWYTEIIFEHLHVCRRIHICKGTYSTCVYFYHQVYVGVSNRTSSNIRRNLLEGRRGSPRIEGKTKVLGRKEQESGRSYRLHCRTHLS